MSFFSIPSSREFEQQLVQEWEEFQSKESTAKPQKLSGWIVPEYVLKKVVFSPQSLPLVTYPYYVAKKWGRWMKHRNRARP